MCDPNFDKTKYYARILETIDKFDVDLTAAVMNGEDQMCDLHMHTVLAMTSELAPALQAAMKLCAVILVSLGEKELVAEMAAKKKDLYRETTGEDPDEALDQFKYFDPRTN